MSLMLLSHVLMAFSPEYLQAALAYGLITYILPYLDKCTTQTKKKVYPNPPIDQGFNERINHLTLLSL
jgi:hypothetical protein